MGRLIINAGDSMSPTGVYRSFASQQPSFFRMFGGEASLAQACRNQSGPDVGAGNATICGAPTLSQIAGLRGGYLTCVGNNGGGLILPQNMRSPYTVIAAVRVQTFDAVTPSQAQFVGAFRDANHLTAIEFNAIGFTGYAGNWYGELTPKLAYSSDGPNGWSLWGVSCDPACAVMTLYNLSAGTNSSFVHGGSIDDMLHYNLNLQIGSYTAQDATHTAPMDVALVANWPVALSAPDMSIAYQQYQSMLKAYSGILV